MGRKKQAALEVPGSAEEAAVLAAEYVSIEREALKLRVGTEIAIDMVKADRDRALAAMLAGQPGRFAALKAWWEAGGKALAGKKRSAELAGAQIGIRTTPHSVKFAKGVKAATIVTWLRGLRWSRAKEFLRAKYELDKEAIIKVAREDAKIAARFDGQGVSVVQADEFFIDTGLSEDALRAELADRENQLKGAKP